MSAIITAAAAAKSLQSCLTLRDPIDGSPPGSHPWDSPGKNTAVGCHFLGTWRERGERAVGGGIGMGKTCKLKDVSFQCMTKFTTN